MSQTIVKTRVIPKKITENIVSRGRLLKKFEENANKNVILVMGPAGYGKTTSVLDFLNETKRKFGWLYISTDIDSTASFMSYLVHSLMVLKPDFGENTLELINSFTESDLFNKDETNTVNSIIGSFVNEFVSDFSEDIFIVIDDLHNIDGAAWVINIFNQLTENLPDNLHLIITTRNTPEFNMAKLTAKRKLAKIDSSDLNFTSDETESLLKDIYSITYRKEDVGKLISKIEGWITGLHLILQAYGIDFPKIASGKQMLDEDIFSYFAEDIYGQLDKKTQDFVTTTSLLDAFTAEVCEEVFELPESSSILNELKRKNLFIETTQHITEEGSQLTTYSYHNLFKQFLVSKLHETRSKDEIRTLAEKIFGYYLKNGDHIQAIEFSLKAGDFQKASEMILANFDTLFQSSRYETLRRWIDQFPDDFINVNYELLYVNGKLLNFFKNDTEKAFEIFNEIIAHSDKRSRLFINASSEISEIMRHTGKPEEALNIIKELYKLDSDADSKIRIIISLCKSYYRLGSKHYDEILKLLKEAEELCAAHSISSLIPDIYSLFGRIYLNKGEFVKSLHYFESNLNRESNIYRRFNTLNDILLLYSWSGDYNKAKEYYDESASIVNKYKILHFERDLLRLNALLRFEAGDYEEAIDNFNKLFNLSSNKNNKSFLLIYYFFISESYLFLNKIDTAKEYLLLAENIHDPEDEYLSSELDTHKAILKKRAEIDSSMEKLFLSKLKFYDAISYNYVKTQLEFHLADYYFKKENPETCITYLKNCLQTSSDKSYHSFLTQHYLLHRYLFDFALANNINNDYIKFIHSKVMDKFNISWLSEECKLRIQKELPGIYDIDLQTFGGVSLMVRGSRIEDDKWIRKKSKLLLIYLLINQGIRIQKDKVLGIFFSELSADSADNIFHQAITNIRNVLKPPFPLSKADGSKAKKSTKKESVKTDYSPSYILYEDKILQMAQGYEYKIDVIEFNKMAAIVKSPETDESVKEDKAKEAIDLYKGEFMPGYYDEWIEELRSILTHKYIETCEELLAILEKKKKYDDLIDYSEKLISADKLHEEAFYYLILAYKELGNITMAKKKYSQLTKNYEDEYNEKPPKDLLSKIQTILDQ